MTIDAGLRPQTRVRACTVAALVLLALMGAIAPASQAQGWDDTLLTRHTVVEQCTAKIMAKADPIREAIDHCPCEKKEKDKRYAELSAAIAQGQETCSGEGQKWCEWVSEQARRDREAIERQRHTGTQNQKDLSEWKKLNDQAQLQALEDAGKYMLGSFAAASGELGTRMQALEGRVATLSHLAASATTKARRAKQEARLLEAVGDWNQARKALRVSKLARGILDANEAWKAAKNTWHHEFRVAAHHDAAIAAILTDPAFREAFAGAADEKPGMEVLAALETKAIEEATRVAVGIKQFEAETGPEIQAAQFVVDEAYDALASLLSTARVLQQDELAGQAARAAAVLQSRYQKTVDRVKSCRTN